MQRKGLWELIGVGAGMVIIATMAWYGFRGQAEDEQKEAGVDMQPLYITTMTHMEGIFKDDKDEALFRRHAQQIRDTAHLFAEHGARMTVESEQSFAKANSIWNDNVMKWLLDNGHGVGTHADFGAQPVKSFQTYVDMFVENKTLVDSLVGAENNIGVSGGTGPGDWVLAAEQAGFSYLNGITGFAYLSMPLSARPQGWSNQKIVKETYHDGVPYELSDRIHPVFLSDAKDFVEDAGGEFVALTGELGELSSLGEGRSNCAPNCVFDAGDIEALRTMLEEVIAAHKQHPDRVGHLSIHVPVALFDEKYRDLLEDFLDAVGTYVEKGDLVWATQREAYEAVVDARN